MERTFPEKLFAGGDNVAVPPNVTVHRAAANDIDLTKPRAPRLRVQRFVMCPVPMYFVVDPRFVLGMTVTVLLP